MTDSTAIVQTVDFFTPIVDDPYIWGQIVAANALSDVYAMGGTPITALNLLCYPIGTRPEEEIGAILRGGADKCAEAGVVMMGGHSVRDAEPKFGLAVTGVIDPKHIATNDGARPGDAIIITKALGTGIIATAAKFDACDAEMLAAACASMIELNAGAANAMRSVGIGDDGIHAATDITGFSLMGHLWRIATASGVSLELYGDALPILPGAEALANENLPKGGFDNIAYVGSNVTFAKGISVEKQKVMFDPQTSGGLAIFVAQERLSELLDALEREGVAIRAVIGRASEGLPRISVV